MHKAWADVTHSPVSLVWHYPREVRSCFSHSLALQLRCSSSCFSLGSSLVCQLSGWLSHSNHKQSQEQIRSAGTSKKNDSLSGVLGARQQMVS